MNKIKVIKDGHACVYCGHPAQVEPVTRACCGEVHFEPSYVTEDGELLLVTELTGEHEIVNV